MPQIRCAHCGQVYEMTEAEEIEYAGQTSRCTICGRPLFIPGQPKSPTSMPLDYAAPAADAWPTSGLAVASLVCGILTLLVSCLPFISIAAGLLPIALGYFALRATAKDNRKNRKLAAGGIWLGGASAVIAAAMLAFWMPGLLRAREDANRCRCASNMRQIGDALLQYANANRGYYPPRLEDLIITQGVAPNLFLCPDSRDTPAPGSTPAAQAAALSAGGHCSYIYIPGQREGGNADCVVLYEPLSHHRDGMNVLFLDGHVEFIDKLAAPGMIADLQAGHNPPKIQRHGEMSIGGGIIEGTGGQTPH